MTHFLSKAVVVNATDKIRHESISDFNIDAGENKLVEIKHAGAKEVLLFLLNCKKKIPEMSFTEILENDVTTRQATLQIALVFE